MLPHSGLSLPTMLHRYTPKQLRLSNTSLRLSSKVILLEASRQLNLVIDVLNSGDFTSLMNININMNVFSPVNLPSVSLICRLLNSISRRIEKIIFLNVMKLEIIQTDCGTDEISVFKNLQKCIYYFLRIKDCLGRFL